ncbi:MAG TPA: DUF1554 domain-containing protein [Leptospiraceae bacterium]|nr:DUF1554 domain-containing protein [Leptospiraceae bacterium]HNN02670.1 DUF1554 domain-containing protein [Leptospiraceae bacterium]HNO22354.1 DUF1554 domain-containing protein [Leptospiraceae bacterium]
MEQLRKFSSEKKKHLGVILIGLQGLGGLALGSYFIKPAVVTTAAVAVSTPLYALECTDDNFKCHNTCRDGASRLSVAAIVIASTNASKSTSTSTSTSTTKKMFLTATKYDGNLGGVSGADSKCNSDSAKPSGTSTYKAFITDVTNRVACTTNNCSGGVSENKDWVLKASTSYYKSDGTTLVFTTNASGIFANGAIKAAVGNSTDETWTGIYSNGADGGWTNAYVAHCSNWSSNSSSGTGGLRGFPGVIPTSFVGDWFGKNVATCDTTRYILCVEQ